MSCHYVLVVMMDSARLFCACGNEGSFSLCETVVKHHSRPGLTDVSVKTRFTCGRRAQSTSSQRLRCHNSATRFSSLWQLLSDAAVL